MICTKKKEVAIFSDGSIITNKIFIKNLKKTKIFSKDHKTVIKKNVNIKKQDIQSFKGKYFKHLNS